MKYKVGDFLTITEPAWAAGAVCMLIRIPKEGDIVCDYVYEGEVLRHRYLVGFQRTRPSTPEEILTAKLQGL